MPHSPAFHGHAETRASLSEDNVPLRHRWRRFNGLFLVWPGNRSVYLHLVSSLAWLAEGFNDYWIMPGLGGRWLNLQTSICLCRQQNILLCKSSANWHVSEWSTLKFILVEIKLPLFAKSLFALPVTSFSAPACVLLVNYMGIRGQLSCIPAKWQIQHTDKRLDTSLFGWPAASQGSIWWSTSEAVGGCAGSCESVIATLTTTLTPLTGWEIEPSVPILKLAKLVLLMINTNRLKQKVGKNV